MSQSLAAGPRVTRSAFFSALFAQCAGVIELRAFPSKARCFAGLGDGTRGGQFIRQRSAKEDVYLGVATRRDARSGTLANCQHLGALFVDVDFKTTPEAEIRAFVESTYEQAADLAGWDRPALERVAVPAKLT